jgi:TRAP transporter 4TM/12TM fusion protein
MWLTTEGVFGIALGVSSSFVFLFVLFGSLLDKAGAGNYFIKVAFALLGHLRGGPAKAAVLSSGMTGLISGSSIANTVTTGTFTIPLMRRVGFSGEKAGAIEVSASVNGQIMPPVMGAAAFIMVEYVGISYLEVIKHAFVPAMISYIALLYIVHLEAVKADLPSLPKLRIDPWKQRLIGWGIISSSLLIIAGIAYFAISTAKEIFGDSSFYVVVAALFVVYLALIAFASKFPDLEVDDPDAPILELPEAGATIKTGLHYLLPIVVLVWCLMIERFSPGLSAFWATILMIVILATQDVLKNAFRKEGKYLQALRKGLNNLFEGMVVGSRNMIGIGVATAAAGIIVGTVSLTGIGQVLAQFIEFLAGDSMLLVLLFTGIVCLILGMGLPTTANYIVVASLMAQVVVELGTQNGLVIPLIAVHLFVFYFGIMADVTPPVGLASFAAAAISGADPIKTGIQAFTYSIRTAILPFFFILNTELILIGVDSLFFAAWIFVKATAAILIFSAAAQNYFLVRSRFYETIILYVVATTLFVPNVILDFIQPPYVKRDPWELEKVVMDAQPGDNIKVVFESEDFDNPGHLEDVKVLIKIGEGNSFEERLHLYGITAFRSEGRRLFVDDTKMMSDAEAAGITFDFEVIGLAVHQERISPRWLNIPAVILLLIVVASQSVRRKRDVALKKL